MAGVKKGWRRQREEVRTQKPGTDSCSHWGWKNTDKMAVTGPAISQQAFSPRMRTSSLPGSALELRKCGENRQLTGAEVFSSDIVPYLQLCWGSPHRRAR